MGKCTFTTQPIISGVPVRKMRKFTKCSSLSLISIVSGHAYCVLFSHKNQIARHSRLMFSADSKEHESKDILLLKAHLHIAAELQGNCQKSFLVFFIAQHIFFLRVIFFFGSHSRHAYAQHYDAQNKNKKLFHNETSYLTRTLYHFRMKIKMHCQAQLSSALFL